MPSELTNLLPKERREKVVREYRLRFGVVSAFVFSLLVCVAGILLIPTYLYLTATASMKGEQLAQLTSKLSSSNEMTLASRLTILSRNAESLASLSKKSSTSSLLRDALLTPRPGVLLSGFMYTAAGGKSFGVLTLSGVASTREALRNYQMALEKAAFARKVELPVSVYAKDANIPFTITVTLAP